MSKIQKPWFIVDTPIATCYSEPNFNSAKVTEAISGESIQVLTQNREWVQVEQDDGYKSWTRNFFGRFADKPFPATHITIHRGKFPFGMRVRLKNKNLLKICNTPMFLMVAKEAMKSKYFDKVYVSLEDKKTLDRWKKN